MFFVSTELIDLFLCGLAGFLLLLGASEAWWWGADLTGRARSITDVTVMDGSRDAIVLLQVNLQQIEVKILTFITFELESRHNDSQVIPRFKGSSSDKLHISLMSNK